MTKTSTIARPLLALVAALVAAPLAAEEPMTVTGQPILQEVVSFADLDLRHWSAQRSLETPCSPCGGQGLRAGRRAASG